MTTIDAPTDDDVALLPGEPTDRRYVGALARGLEVLRCFTPDDQWLGHREMARRTGLPPSTVSRLVYTLIKVGCLKAGPRKGQYGLDVGVISLGFSMLGRYDIARIARPHMQALADEAGVSGSLAARQGLSAVFLGHWRSAAARPVIGLEVGAKLPLASTATGRALIAMLEPAERQGIIVRLRHEPADFDPAEVDRWLDAYDRDGYTVSDGEWEHDVSAVAVPLQLGSGLTPLALTCGGSRQRLQGPELRAVGERLVAVADEVRRAVQRGG